MSVGLTFTAPSSGGTLLKMNTGRPPASPEERFWKYVRKTRGCWLWTGALVQPSGYAQFKMYYGYRNYRNMYAHIFSYDLHKGPVPSGKQVCHSCDVRHCVNPRHLWVGTQSDNMQDMLKKGRNKPLCGKENPMYGKCGPLNPMWGTKRTFSEKTLQRMREVHTGVLHTAASKKKISRGLRKFHANRI